MTLTYYLEYNKYFMSAIASESAGVGRKGRRTGTYAFLHSVIGVEYNRHGLGQPLELGQ